MGFLSKIFKGAKKLFKKSVKRIKKIGSKVWKGVKNVVKGIGKAFTKLGPIAMIASYLIPGVGPFFAGMWNTFGSTMGAWAQAGNFFQQAIGTVGKGIFNGVNWIKGAANSISDSISEGFKALGKGNFSEGVNTLGDTFSKAVNAGDQATRVGTATAEAAQAAATATTNQVTATEQFSNNISKAINQPAGQADFIASPLTDEATRQAATSGAVDGFIASPLADSGVRQTAVNEAASGTAKSSLMDRALKAGSTFFQAQGAEDEAQQYIPGFTPEAPESQFSQQVGSIGSASGGGSFLSQQQLEGYNAYWNNSLGIGRRVGGTANG